MGADGQTVLRYPVSMGTFFGFGVQHTNYVSREVTFISGEGRATDIVPAEYTFI